MVQIHRLCHRGLAPNSPPASFAQLTCLKTCCPELSVSRRKAFFPQAITNRGQSIKLLRQGVAAVALTATLGLRRSRRGAWAPHELGGKHCTQAGPNPAQHNSPSACSSPWSGGICTHSHPAKCRREDTKLPKTRDLHTSLRQWFPHCVTSTLTSVSLILQR